MKIAFIMTSLILMFIFIVVKKSDKKLNILECIITAIVIILGYNTIICYIMYETKVKINFTNLSIINFIFIGILIYKIVKDKKYQKFYLNKEEIVQKILITIIVISICILNYSTDLNIKYASIDATAHYNTAVQFSKSDELKEEAKGFMPMAYINTGLLMKIFSGNIDDFDLYQIFIIFDILILVLIALTMNTILLKFCHNKTSRIIAMILTILYTLGYAFNSICYGFSYLTISILVINTIFIFFQNYSNKDFDFKINTICLFILNFSLFFSYYVFVPFIYGAEILFGMYNNKEKNNKYVNSRFIILGIVTIIIPLICGLQYHIFYEKEKVNELIVGILVEGPIYRDIYSNFIIILPLSIYLFIKEKQKNQYIYYVFVDIVLYIIILAIVVYFGKISLYYLIKNLFILWGICFIIIGKWIDKLITKHNIYINAMLIVLLSLILSLSNVYYENVNIILNKKSYGIIYTKEEKQLLKKSREIIDYTDVVSIIGNYYQRSWASKLMGYDYVPNSINLEKVNYIIYFYNANFSEEYVENLVSNMELLYKNDSGAIYKK